MASLRKRRADADADGDDGQRIARPRGARQAATGTAANNGRAARRAAEQATRRSGVGASTDGTNEGEANKGAGAVCVAASACGAIPRFDEEAASGLPYCRPCLSAGGADGSGSGAAGAATAVPASLAGASLTALGTESRQPTNEDEIIPARAVGSPVSGAGSSTQGTRTAGAAPLPAGAPSVSTLSGGGSPTPGLPSSISAPPPAGAPSVAVLLYCFNFIMEPLRAVVRQEVATSSLGGSNFSAVAAEVVNAAVPAFAAAVPAVRAPEVAWSRRSEEEIKLATAKVFPNKLIRKVYADMLCLRVLALYDLASACGDVLTPFFPPQAKLESSEPFVLAHFNTMCVSVLQGLYKAMCTRPPVPDILVGKGRVRRSRLDAVDEAFLTQLRTLFNDGRSAARALFYRFIGFFFMHTSPKVTIRLVSPSAPVPDLQQAEGSPFFEIETTLVATRNGVVPDVITSPLPPSAAHGPSGGSFISISSHVNYTGALGGAETIIRQVGTESSFTTADGARYPHISGETLVKQQTCIFRFSRRLARQIIKGKVAVDAKAIFAIAMCVRSMLSGRQIAWTAPDGSDWTHADVVGPCQWWLLVPKPTARLTVNRKLQTLTKEELNALQMGGNGAPAGLVNALLDGDDDDEEEAAELDDDGGRESELELDG